MVKSRRIAVYIALAAIAILAVLLCLVSPKSKMAPFSLELATNDKKEEIHLWKQENGGYYCFLPSYAESAKVSIKLLTENEVRLDGVLLEDGMSCNHFPMEESLTLIFFSWGVERRSTVTFMRSENIPAMYIDTQSGSMDFIHEKKGNEESGEMRLYLEDGTLDSFEEINSFNGRGNATWTKAEKKPYSITLSKEADLLGMGAARKWILLSNALEHSNIRNKLVYDFAKSVGMTYSPDAQWIDLYLNGEYAGLYLLCERNEVHPERVDISQNDSFLVSLELEERLAKQSYPYVRTSAGVALRIHYPKVVTEAVEDELLLYWQTLENAVMAENGIDSITGNNWKDILDLDSWVEKCLVEEIFGNIDACFMSQYFYLDGAAGDIAYAGPIWDFDNAIGIEESWSLREPNILFTNRLHVRPGYDSPWFHALYQKEEFFTRLTELYEKEFLNQMEFVLNEKLSEYAETIGKSHDMNRLRWQTQASDMQTECEEIRSYLEQRIAFLNDIWLESVPFCTVKADQGFGSYYTHYAVYTNEKLECLPDFEDTDTSTFSGWYYKDTNEPFDASKPITEDIEIYAKWQDKPSKKMDQIIKLVPLGVIGVLGGVLVICDIRKSRRR